MNGESRKNVVNLDDMKAFADELARYIDETEKALANIRRRHNDIGAERVWVSPQYDQLSDVIDDVNRRMADPIEDLKFSQLIVSKKWSELDELYKQKL